MSASSRQHSPQRAATSASCRHKDAADATSTGPGKTATSGDCLCSMEETSDTSAAPSPPAGDLASSAAIDGEAQEASASIGRTSTPGGTTT